MKKYIFTISVLWMSFAALAQNNVFCGISNNAFEPGERLVYKVYYNISFAYIGAGEVTFTTALEKLNNKPVFHVVGNGRTYSSYDWIFKVRDRYETYIDTSTMLPLRFIRNVNEGDYRKYNVVNFDQEKQVAVSHNGSFELPRCIQDVLSAIYYARNINFNRYSPGDKIPFDMFLDDEVYHIYIRYLGKEKVQTRYGTFNAIKFSPLLIQGTIFKGGEEMSVWVSDDLNKVPVRIDSPITVGSIKVDLVGYDSLRHPFSALIKKK